MSPGTSDNGDHDGSRPPEPVYRHRRVPVRALLPNFFTLLSLCAGLTAIRMAFDGHFELAVLLVAAAAFIDGIDGRLARALKVQSRFGAELDSLADTVAFGVAPALVLYAWGLRDARGFGWIAALVFACCMALRLARFNAALDTEKPKWMSNYFTGIPAPAGAIVVLLPFYLHQLGLVDIRGWPFLVAIYTLAIAFMLVSTIPTWSGKLLGERISREYVLPLFAGAALLVGFLWTYPYATVSALVTIYLALVPLSYRRYRARLAADAAAHTPQTAAGSHHVPTGLALGVPPGETKH